MDDSTAIERFRALGDPVRWGIIPELRQGTRCACVVADMAGVQPPLLSHHLKVLRRSGSGCKNCQTLEKITVEALTETGIDAAVDHVSDPQEIMTWGVMSTPALVIDDEVVLVVLVGRVPGPGKVRDLIAAAAT